MNKHLEKKMTALSFGDEAFDAGFEAAIDLNLPVMFAVWLCDNSYAPSNILGCWLKPGEISTDAKQEAQLYDLFLEETFGGKEG